MESKNKSQITKEEVFESLKDVTNDLKKVVSINDSLYKITKFFSGNIDPLKIPNDRAYNIFRDNIINNIDNSNLKNSLYYIFEYVFSNKENQKALLGYIRSTFGIQTPITKRRIKKPYISEDESNCLTDTEKIDLYIDKVVEVFDCFKEVINYKGNLTPTDNENKRIVFECSNKVLKIIYDLICKDIRLRIDSKSCLEKITEIINVYSSPANKLIQISPEELDKLKESLNKNIILYEKEDVLYGNLVIDFIKEYNSNILYQEAVDVVNNLIKSLTKNGYDKSLDNINSVSTTLKNQIKKHNDKSFMIILNYLLEKECDNAFNGDSYEYYKAIIFLSLDCTMQLRKRKIYIDEEDLFTKDVINKIAS